MYFKRWGSLAPPPEKANLPFLSESVFGYDHHAVLLQEGHGYGILKTPHAAKSLNDRQCELRECLVSMKSALSDTL
jgi:hypothetical protein